MSAYNTGFKLCGPDGNGCLCPVCVNWRSEKELPYDCHKGACGDCDPDRTEPDTTEDYGPTRECRLFKPDKSRIEFFRTEEGREIGKIYKIAACPHCGGVARIIAEPGEQGGGFRVCCDSCFAQTGLSITQEEAIKRWNARSG